MVRRKKPRRCWIAVPCTAYTIMQNLRKKTKKSLRKLKFQRKEARQIIRQCLRIAREVVRHHGDVVWEWPRTCRAWRLKVMKRFQRWLAKKGVTIYNVDVDGCMFGLVNPDTGHSLKKSWRLMCTEAAMLQVTKTCSVAHRKEVPHDVIQGKLTAMSAFYPTDLVHRVCQVWQQG